MSDCRFKKGHNVVTPWQRRRFYIADGKLMYYREPKDGTAGSSKEPGKLKEIGKSKDKAKDGGRSKDSIKIKDAAKSSGKYDTYQAGDAIKV